MGAINFYLKKAEAVSEKSLIILQWKYNGRKLVFSTKQSIDPKNWNKDKQRVKNNKQTTADGQHFLNDLLDTLALELQRAYNIEVKNGIPSPESLRKYLSGFLQQHKSDADKPTLFTLIERFINNEIHFKGKSKAVNTIKKYRTTRNRLKEFEAAAGYPVNFDTINLDFFYRYVSFLKAYPQKDKAGKTVKRGLAQNSIAKDIQVIKTFMNEAVDLRYTTNMEHKNRKFVATWVDVDAIYLTEEEIYQLSRFDLSDNKRLEQTRDLFVVGASTGLRFSDYSNVKPENIVMTEGEYYIKMDTLKTKERVIIPCSSLVLEIFEKYSDRPNRLPRSLSNQKFNEYIKEVCKKAGLTQKGRLISDPDKELWECVSSHTCRRSFATNLYLQGFPAIDIMKITGHRTEKAFLKYIKVSKLDVAKKLNQHMKLKWSEKLLRVA